MALTVFCGFYFMPRDYVYTGYSAKQMQREQKIADLRKQLIGSKAEDEIKMRLNNEFAMKNYQFIDLNAKHTKREFDTAQARINGEKLIRTGAGQSNVEINSDKSYYSGANAIASYIKNISK